MATLILTLISSFPVYIIFKILYTQKLNKTTYELKSINFNYLRGTTQYEQEILTVNTEYLNYKKVIYIPFVFDKKEVVVKDCTLHKENFFFKPEILIHKN